MSAAQVGGPVKVEAPSRADLAGGTLDIWPLGILHPGAMTVNVAIPVMVRLVVDTSAAPGEVEHVVDGGTPVHLGADKAVSDLSAAVVFAIRPQGGVRIEVTSQAPMGSGLGGSSSYAVALARGVLEVSGKTMEDAALVTLLRDLEARILCVPTGVQDHWPAAVGGAVALHLEPGGERPERLDVDPEWMGSRLTVFFSGITHHSGMVNWQVIRRRLEAETVTTTALGKIAEAAGRCRAALLARDAAQVGAAISDEWRFRKRLAPEVCPIELEEIETAVRAAGAMAMKACGAGGGGSVLVWHEPEARDRVVAALGDAAPKGRLLTTAIALDGCRVSS